MGIDDNDLITQGEPKPINLRMEILHFFNNTIASVQSFYDYLASKYLPSSFYVSKRRAKKEIKKMLKEELLCVYEKRDGTMADHYTITDSGGNKLGMFDWDAYYEGQLPCMQGQPSERTDFMNLRMEIFDAMADDSESVNTLYELFVSIDWHLDVTKEQILNIIQELFEEKLIQINRKSWDKYNTFYEMTEKGRAEWKAFDWDNYNKKGIS